MLPIGTRLNCGKTPKMLTHFPLIAMVMLASPLESVNITYDISQENSDLVSKTEFRALFSSTASIRPFQDVTITNVMEGDVLLWESEKEGQQCSFIAIFRFEDLVTLLCLKIATGEGSYKLYFVKEGGVWDMLEDGKFGEVLNSMKSKIPGENEILLDIKNPDREKLKVTRRNTGGADFVTFTTIHPFNTIKIVDGTKLIWRGRYNEDSCVDCAVYLKNENFELLQAFLCSEDEVGFKFFIKDQDRWTNLEKDEFYKSLKRLDIEEDDRMERVSREGASGP